MKRGDLVFIWFDEGAGGKGVGGPTILYGEVIAAGPRAYRVRWESGLTNRITRGGWRAEPELITRPDEIEEARRLLARRQA